MRNKIELINDDYVIYDFFADIIKKSKHSLGYPCNHKFDYSELSDFLEFSLNNVGDPFGHSNYQLNTHKFEREIIEWISGVYGLDKSEAWGYVTSGGTEGNLYGLYVAREICPHGILYFSEDTHYSIKKIAHILDMQYVVIKSQANGEMNYDDFNYVIKNNRKRGAIVCANIGTTMKGAIDNIDEINSIIKDNAIYSSYIHCDAALFGMMIPFIKSFKEEEFDFSFRNKIDSVSISGHKFIGCPMPSGMLLTRRRNSDRVVSKSIEYIGGVDSTILGSRNGLSVLMLYKAINKGKEYFENETKRCLELANYAWLQLGGVRDEVYINFVSNIVWFKKPNNSVIEKWQLAVKDDFAHIIIMPHVTKEMIDEFVYDYKRNEI